MPHLDPTSEAYAARYYRLLEVLKTEGLVEPRYDANSPGEWLAWAHGVRWMIRFLFESRSQAILLANDTLPAPRSFPEIDELMRYLNEVFHRDGNQGDILGSPYPTIAWSETLVLLEQVNQAERRPLANLQYQRESLILSDFRQLPDNLESMGQAIHNIAVDQHRMHGTLIGLLESLLERVNTDRGFDTDHGEEECRESQVSPVWATHSSQRIRVQATRNVPYSSPGLQGGHPHKPIGCPRGGIQFVLEGATSSRRKASGWDTLSTPAQVATSSVSSFLMHLTSNLPLEQVLETASVIRRTAPALEGTTFQPGESFPVLAARCALSLTLDAAVSFWTMVNFIQLAFRVSSELRRNKQQTVARIWCHKLKDIKKGPKPKKRTFQGWCSKGVKFARVAGGGSIYILVLIALQGLRKPFGDCDRHLAEAVGNMLRCPDDSATGQIITNIIVPYMVQLRQQYLDTSDKDFNSLRTNTFRLLPRLKAKWHPCYDPVAATETADMVNALAVQAASLASPSGSTLTTSVHQIQSQG
ncbi:uncharacterized protein B0H18DRAFT_1124231 [Fomitopsis serialis]|uniref:uncharacterized protein n=1 Tax=Fomitopsis serialis TaxID=139415 RepID=UPI002008B864|nr:uncharacterized protein B0H18DRAFT_1124231 [Neoantrodia serialis]KAH9916433.1 hypothetical protein B0H18DRAFT_1124231 [Neoantrodia serialis]